MIHICDLTVQGTAWTLADLGGRDAPAPWDTAEALDLWRGHRP